MDQDGIALTIARLNQIIMYALRSVPRDGDG